MRCFSLAIVLVLIGIASCQRRRVGFFNPSVRTRNQGHFTSPLIQGNTVVNSATPSGARGCFCLPPNQKCNPSGDIPRAATRISKINTRIVNNNPTSNCPEGQTVCCFGSAVGNPSPTGPVTSPLNCGGRATIFPGTPNTANADFGEYPWMAAIVGSNNAFVAGGALIHPQWVLTAAHKVTNPQSLRVRLGDYDLGSPNEFPGYPHIEIGVSQVVLHPQFNAVNLFNDVALLRLQRPVIINPSQPHINVACLPERGQIFIGQRCFVSGWGQNSGGNFQAVLKEVDLPILEGFDCEARFQRTRLTESFRLDQNSFICAGGEAGKDACRGDGGSPLVCEEGGVYTVAGLVAWGIGCGERGVPGAYVNVASFANFIENQIYGTRG